MQASVLITSLSSFYFVFLEDTYSMLQSDCKPCDPAEEWSYVVSWITTSSALRAGTFLVFPELSRSLPSCTGLLWTVCGTRYGCKVFSYLFFLFRDYHKWHFCKPNISESWKLISSKQALFTEITKYNLLYILNIQSLKKSTHKTHPVHHNFILFHFGQCTAFCPDLWKVMKLLYSFFFWTNFHMVINTFSNYAAHLFCLSHFNCTWTHFNKNYNGMCYRVWRFFTSTW